MYRRIGAFLPLVVLGCALAAGCYTTINRSASSSPAVALDTLQPYLKAHLRSGDVVLFSTWQIDTVARSLTGLGRRYDFNRQAADPKPQALALDSVVLFESNRVVQGTSATMAIIGGVSLVGAAYCAAIPKACFGSCPTIYVGEGTRAVLEAESFSSSVAPSLEATDVDALPSLRVDKGVATVHVRNEALETHNIRSMTLLAVPHAPDETVYADEQGGYWRAAQTLAPTSCRGDGEDCLDAVRAPGGGERTSRVDPGNLATREVIELTFPATALASPLSARGLVLRSRQSLVSTFLFYQTLAWMGRQAGTWFAALERGDPTAHRQARVAAEALGGVDVQVPDAHGEWRTVASIAEHGPLAADTRVVPLPASETAGPLRVRLVMAKGAWRVDHVALALLVGKATPLAVAPYRVMREQRSGVTEDTSALRRLVDSTRFLTTFPGDGYAVHFKVPAGPSAMSYFLSVRGYYLEWMRQEWMAEENPRAALALLSDPARALRTLAPRFAALEPEMERSFWESRHALR